MHRLQLHEAQKAREEKARRVRAQMNMRNVEEATQLPFKARIKRLHTLDEARLLAQEARTSECMDPAAFSRHAYKALLANKASSTVLLGFLKDPSLNLPQVHNVMAFVADRRRLSHDFYITLSQLLSLGMVHPLELRKILDALPIIAWGTIQKIWKGMKACRVVPDWTSCARQLLQRLNTGHAPDGSGMFKLELYQHAFPMSQSQSPIPPDLGLHLTCWVTSVHGQLPNKAEDIDRATLVRIVELVGRLKSKRQFLRAATASLLQQRPADDSDFSHWHSLINTWMLLLLEAKFSKLPARERDPRRLDQFFDIISEHLTPRDMTPFFEHQATVFSSSIIAQAWVPRLCSAWSPADSIAMQRDLRLIPRTNLRSRDFTRPTDHFADIVISLARRGFDYEASMKTIINFCQASYGIDGVFWLVKTWRYAQVRIIPEALGSTLRSLSQSDSWTALALYTKARLWIGSSPELLSKLITDGASAYKVMSLLKHKDPTNSVPVPLRDSPKNTLHHTRNTLVHVVADALSRCHNVRRMCGRSGRIGFKRLRNRQVFRNVYGAYRYLVTRQSPIRPLMSRALVRAAIIRPLERYKWVTTARIRFILEVVGRVEGEEVATELDKKIYLWRGKVHRFIMSREAYMRRQGIDSRQEQEAKELQLRRSREKQASRRRHSLASIRIDNVLEDFGARGEEEKEALSLLDKTISPSRKTSSHLTKLHENADDFTLDSVGFVRSPGSPSALLESFSISPHFDARENESLNPPKAETPTTSRPQTYRGQRLPDNAFDLLDSSDISNPNDTQSEHEETPLLPKDAIGSLLIPQSASRDPFQHRRTPHSPNTHIESSTNQNYVKGFLNAAPVKTETHLRGHSSQKIKKIKKIVGDFVDLRASRHPVDLEYSVGTAPGGTREAFTPFGTTSEGLLRYQVKESVDRVGYDEPLSMGMTFRGYLSVQARYKRDKHGILVRWRVRGYGRDDREGGDVID